MASCDYKLIIACENSDSTSFDRAKSLPNISTLEGIGHKHVGTYLGKHSYPNTKDNLLLGTTEKHWSDTKHHRMQSSTCTGLWGRNCSPCNATPGQHICMYLG